MSEPRLRASRTRAEQGAAQHESPSAVYVENRREDGLTVLIRARNHRAFLPGALHSALEGLACLEEIGLPAEIVVIDDASLDGSQKLLRSVQTLYNETRLEALYLKASAGAERLLSLGLNKSAFRHVCIMDADNELLPANLPLFLRSAWDTGAAMVYGNVVEKVDGEVIGVRSNMPAIPSLPKSRRLDAFSIVDAEKFPGLEEIAAERPADPEGWKVALRLLAAEEEVVFVPAVLGYHHERSMSRGRKLWYADRERASARRRTGLRKPDSARIGRIYHPEVGFVDE